MRYAVLSDVHSNLEALCAVMTFLASQRIDQYFSLGDLIGYGADPSACLAHLQERGALMVAGNHEWACLGKLDLNWFNRAAKTAALWTRDCLSFAELDALRRLPLTATHDICTLVHAGLRHPERFEYLVDLAQIVDTLAACETLLCLAGHTHVPCLVEYDRQQHRVTRMLTAMQELTAVTYDDESDRLRYLLNPGSVGQPRDGDPRAGVAIIDTHRKQIAVHRIAYDVAAAQQKIRAAGLPAFLAERLSVGR